jgi:hypothetical protein
MAFSGNFAYESPKSATQQFQGGFMICLNCGAKNPGEAKFCCKCGAHVTSAIPGVNRAQPGVQYNSRNRADEVEKQANKSAPNPALTYPALAKPYRARRNWNALWPKIVTIADAIAAAKQGILVCFLVAALTAILALFAAAHHGDIMGVNKFSLIDAAVFAIAGWRLLRLSRAWAVVALVLYLMEAGFRLYEGAFTGIPLMVVFVIALLNGVRGAFAYHQIYEEHLRKHGGMSAQAA